MFKHNAYVYLQQIGNPSDDIVISVGYRNPCLTHCSICYIKNTSFSDVWDMYLFIYLPDTRTNQNIHVWSTFPYTYMYITLLNFCNNLSGFKV